MRSWSESDLALVDFRSLRHFASLGCALILFATVGCGGDPQARYTPSDATALAALETALKAWQRGEPVGAVAGTSPCVQVVDCTRRGPSRLQEYKILGPAPGEGPRVYAVRLSLRNPAEEQTARFVIMGIDPLWVMRYEDYEMLIHWECPDDARTAKASRKK